MVMAFFCYVYQTDKSVPYMEAAPGQTYRAAKAFAQTLLGSHDDTEAVEIFHNDRPLARIERSWNPK